MHHQLRAMLVLIGIAGYFLLAIFYLRHTESVTNGQWWSASREPAGLAPDPRSTSEAVVQVYAARTVGWRGYVGVHTWIAVKRTAASRFTVYEVIGYRISSGNVVVASQRHPDARWFGARPELLSDVRGEGVDRIIDDVEAAVRSYPYAHRYRVWPGPNSNTFIAWVLRHAPKLRTDLPATAIGKDYLGWLPIAKAPSNTGVQLNLFGVLGVIIAWREGVEFNLLALTFGIDLRRLSIKLPLIGRVGLLGEHFPSRLQNDSSAPPRTL
jgi:uncharacterized protein DUF3750